MTKNRSVPKGSFFHQRSLALEAPTAGCLVLPKKKTFTPSGSLRKGLPTLKIEPLLLGLSNTLPFRRTYVTYHRGEWILARALWFLLAVSRGHPSLWTPLPFARGGLQEFTTKNSMCTLTYVRTRAAFLWSFWRGFFSSSDFLFWIQANISTPSWPIGESWG